MLSSALRCLRPSSCTLALSRQLAHMDPSCPRPVETIIRTKLTQALKPEHLERHRLVNQTLQVELSTCVHALAIQAKTPQQWSSNPSLTKSPACMGGSKHDGTMSEKLKAGRD